MWTTPKPPSIPTLGFLHSLLFPHLTMPDSPPNIALLFPLHPNLTPSNSPPPIPILKGTTNTLGRSNLSIPDKRVSRHHITFLPSLDGSSELHVEGSNPVMVRSGGQRKKVCSGGEMLVRDGDVVEMIPGAHLYKYVVVECAEGHVEDGDSMRKRKRQVVEDEVFARTLQDVEDKSAHVNSSMIAKAGDSRLRPAAALTSCSDAEAIRGFSVPNDIRSLIFRLMRVQGLPAWANTSSVAVEDVIQGNVLVAILSNYMVDIDWLLSACPGLRKIPHVLVVHGESGERVEMLKKDKPANWILHKPPLPISYGTHHSKAMLLVYQQGVRIVVHTANLIHVDWNNKTQGLWMQDFPWKGENLNKGCLFENDLFDYLNTLKWPEFGVNLPVVGNVKINASFFKKFDYSNAAVRLIASVPGYHMGPNVKKWGHMKLRSVLEECIFDKEFCKSPLIYQFSSLGSLDEKWLAEFASSVSAGMTNDRSPLGIGKSLIIWPTVEDVRCSLEGYRAGNAIPSPQKNVEKEFLKKYWARWKAAHVGRCRAMPHIKTYTRYNGQNLAWFLLTSANLSKAAWGSLQKSNSQLMIRSYELGVLFLPTTIQGHVSAFSCTENGGLKQGESKPSIDNDSIKTKLATLCWNGCKSRNLSSEVIQLPVPYQLPPQPYTSEDVPWSWDRRYTKKDVYGQVWPS